MSSLSVDVLIDTGLGYKGTVTAVPGANQFTIATLAGQGAGKFDGATNPYKAFVLRDNGGLGAAPQGEIQTISAYNSTTGAFTAGAFSAAVAVGDEVLILHPAIAGLVTSGGGIVASGTFTTSSATVPADTGKAALASQYFRGCLLMPIAGVCAYQPRMIRAFTTGTGVYTLDGDEPFTAAPGLVAYVILPDYNANHLPTADAALNQDSNDVIGNKADTPNWTINSTNSLMRYVKALLGYAGIVTPTVAGTKTMYASVTANWQAAEQDLLTIGAAVAGQATLINFLGVGIQNLIGNITIRMYCTINGTERRFFPIPQWLTFNVVADAPCIPTVNGSIIVPGRLRVTVQSDNAADNGAAVTYEAG